jgi:N-acetylglutamate synthase-like GNAT family acetyltransferase
MYTIVTDKSRLDINLIHRFLSERSYWAKNIPLDVVRRSIDNSLCFGVFDGQEQMGFGRVITDCATFAYVADVFILEEHRGRGASKQLMRAIMEHSSLKGIRRWHLVTTDAHGLYEQFGFREVETPRKHMERVVRNAYEEN